METEDYRSVCVEGGDQVGKGDATERILKEIEADGVNLTYSSFPIYATPIGTTIRSLLKNGCPENILSSESNLDVRMTLFALNRLEFLDVYLSDEKYSDTLLVLDRSPYSNAVTIGYGLSLLESWNSDEIGEYVDRAMDYDSLMNSKLGLDSCVIQLKSEESEWKNIRGAETDQYEREDVQDRCNGVYEVYKDRVGSGWNEVVTKGDDGWKSRDDIWGEIDDILCKTYGSMEEIRKGKRYDIGFKEIVDGMYTGAEYDSDVYSKYDLGLKENYKDQMYRNGIVLGKQVVDSCLNVKFSNDVVREEFKRIILLVPESMNVFRHFLGDEFVAKLQRGLGL